MTIEEAEAAGNYTYQGKTYYFCSPSAFEFEKDPKVYTDKKQSLPAAAGPFNQTHKKKGNL